MTDNTSPPPASVHADLAFLKGLVDDSGGNLAEFGWGYGLAGLIYGVQVTLQWLAYAGVLPIEGTPIYLAVVTLPTIMLIVALSWRKTRARSQTSRAINAVFQGAGIANLVVLAAIAAAAIGQGAYPMIMSYAAVIFAFQGACWFVIYRLRRRAWMLAIAVAWFASGLGSGLALGAMNIHAYIAIALFDMFVLMALPGAIIVRNSRKEASP